jgi:hypothetical protein
MDDLLYQIFQIGLKNIKQILNLNQEVGHLFIWFVDIIIIEGLNYYLTISK